MTRAMTAWVLLLASACGGSAPEVVAPPEPPPEREVAPEPVETPAKPVISGKQGVVFSPDGKPVELRVLATGATIPVEDGTPLELIAEQSGPGFGRAEAEVVIGGDKGVLPNVAAMVGERVRTSPASKVTIFFATSRCSPICSAEVWGLHADGRRVMLGDGVIDPVVAFSPDGLQAAVGGGGLWLLLVGTWRTLHYGEFTAPAFAPDDALFVRHHGTSDTVFQLFFGGQAALVVTVPGKPATEEPIPVTFEDGGATVVAVFARADGPKTLRTAR